jgi:two-component system chemotaxis sensor kinase CheA
MSIIELDAFLDTFFEEADEHVAALESSLLGLDSAPDDRELMNAAFRAAHSLKGGSSMFGLTNITRFTHEMETLFDQVRKGKYAWEQNLATLFLRSVDVLRDLLAAKGATLSSEGEALMVELADYGKSPAPTAAEASEDQGSAPSPAPSSEEKTGPVSGEPPSYERFVIRFAPHADVFSRGADLVLVLRDLAAVSSELEVEPDTSALPDLEALDPSASYLEWTFRVACPGGAKALDEVFELVADAATVTVERLDATPEVSQESAPRHEAVAIAPAPTAEFAQVVRASAPTPIVAPASGPWATAEKAPSTTAQSQAKAPPVDRGNGSPNEGATVRIATKKVDRILDILGEVVIAKATIAQKVQAESGSSAELREALATLERHTRELQESVMSVRLVPINTVFTRFHRVVRELGTKLGKNVQLVLEGTETEIDRAMVEKLADPLTHIVRNSVDHGIEKTAARIAAGKAPEGVLKLNAVHRSGNVVIEVTDDGKGLDLARVKAKGIEAGLLSPNDEPTVEQLHALVMAPGFSTAAEVTDVSGRGVGMDVVLKNVRAMGGSITFTSEAGRGSRIVLQLPLTMAIIDGLLLRVGQRTFVVPIRSVLESLRPSASQIGTVFGKSRVLHFRDGTIPLVALSDVLDVEEGELDPSRGIVIVVEDGDSKVGIIVDELVSEEQVVVKSLEQNYQPVPGVSGATVLGDGTIALILDVGELARKATTGGRERLRACA